MNVELPVAPPGTDMNEVERMHDERRLDETCSLCGKKYHTYDSPMLKCDIWEKISNEHFDEDGNWVAQHICAECMERKLGRKITEDDLILDPDGLHVLWNEDYIKKNFPSHKTQLFTERYAKDIEEYKKAWGIKE